MKLTTSSRGRLSALQFTALIARSSQNCARCLSTIPPLQSFSGSLPKILRDSIKSTGPMSTSRYMQFCLSHPLYGYYARGDVFGRKGDFITSPEISQVFGELMAIWLLTRWLAAESPPRCRIVELGPGRGTLLDDILRTFSSFPDIYNSITSIHLVENSEKMRTLQGEKLGSRCEEKGIKLLWSDKIDDVPATEEFTMVIAHEFFDAMPINIFEKLQDGFREVLVDLDPAYSPSLPTTTSTSGLRLALSPSPTALSTFLPATSSRFATLPIGSRIEIAQDSWKITRKLGELLGGNTLGGSGGGRGGGGAGLVIDYGGARSFGSSFRAFRDHKIVDVFDEPGSSDLTANVDFKFLEESLDGTGTKSLGPIPQSQFLSALGLQPRLRQLVEAAPDPQRREDIRKAATRLIDPLGMGSQYQIMGLSTSSPGESSEEIYPFPLSPVVTNSPLAKDAGSKTDPSSKE